MKCSRQSKNVRFAKPTKKQVLNFGQPAPVDVRVSGPDNDAAYAIAAKLAKDLADVPGVVDSLKEGECVWIWGCGGLQAVSEILDGDVSVADDLAV